MSITRKIPASTPPRRFLPKFFKTGKACGGNNSPRTPLFLPPGFAGSAGQDEREDYARGQGGGGGVQSEGRFSTLWGPGRRQEHGRRQARSRNSVPALSAAAVVQAMQFVQRVLRKRACVFFGRPARSEIIPPRTPLFLPPGFAGSAGQDEREDYARGQGGGGGLADAVRAAYSVQVCPHGLTCGGRLLSGLRRTVVSKEGISRFLGDDTKCHESKPKSVLLPLGEKQTDDVEPDRKTTEEASPFPHNLRDGPDRVRPANYGGSGEFISSDVFSAFLPFLPFSPLSFLCFGDLCRAGLSGIFGGAILAVGVRSGGVWGVTAAFGEAGMGISNVDNL